MRYNKVPNEKWGKNFMVGYELLRYKMDAEELKVWAIMCLNIKKKFEALELQAIAYETLNKKFFNDEPYSGSRGYSKDRGYYSVSEGDRGSVSVIIIEKAYEVAENQFIKNLADDIGYACILQDKKKIEQEHRHEWHFYRVDDGIVADANGRTRMLSHQVENETWKYDAEYDYRKYWFEITLGILKETVSKDFFEEEIVRYEVLLNHRFDKSFWRFDVNSMTFEQV